MTTAKVVLFDTQFAPVAKAALFASPDGGLGTIVDKFTATNIDVTPRTVSVWVVPPGSTPVGNEFAVVMAKALAAGQCYLMPEVVGQMLASGGAIWVEASAASMVVVRANGRNET
jgi:hypothetical protein